MKNIFKLFKLNDLLYISLFSLGQRKAKVLGGKGWHIKHISPQFQGRAKLIGPVRSDKQKMRDGIWSPILA